MKLRRIMDKRRIGLLFSMLSASFLLVACGGGSSESGHNTETGSISFNLVWQRSAGQRQAGPGRGAPTGDVCVDFLIETIRAEVYNSSDNMVTSASWACNTPDHTGTIEKVKAGSGMYLIIEGVVAGNPDWWQQTEPFSVVAGRNTPVGKVTMEYHGDNPDYDGDGYDSTVAGGSDCDDFDDSIHPGATETCNGVDDNCNDETDEGLTTATFYRDVDGDNYGDPADTIQACAAPAGYVADNTDCNDGSAAIHPGATETCNGIDDNCNDAIDEGAAITFYRDVDGDTYGDPADTIQACAAPAGYVADNTDCNDGSAAIHPGATETCNGIDDNCNDATDEGVTTTFYRDVDGDNYGDPADTIQACAAPAGYVADNTDCNDGSAAIHPGATEACNGVDDNCNDLIDDGLAAALFYRDVDGDNYGDPTNRIQACAAPTGYVADNTDCNDGSAAIHPGATETCNGVDDNCNNVIDEGVTITFYRDADGDNYGDPADTVQACSAPAGYVTDNTDCDDGNANSYPGAAELCDGLDNNCNQTIDDNVAGGCLFIEGQLHHRGTPMTDITNANPSFWVRDEDTGQSHPDYTAYYNPADGTYGIYNLPVNAGIQIVFHVTGESDTVAGNYRSWMTWDSSMPSQIDINVPLVMHLVAPWDNSNITWAIGEHPLHASPLYFQWDALPGPVEYQVRIDRYRDPENPSGYGYIGNILFQSIANNSFVNPLNPSEPFEHYEFAVSAYDNNVQIAYYMTTYTNGYGWDYRFKIAPAVTLSSGQGYDFSAGTVGDVGHGDFYFLYQNSQINFWANNLGMNGLQDVGYYVNLMDVTVPASGYNRFGVPVVEGHTYVSLAAAGEEGNYIIFTVVAATTSQVTLHYYYGSPPN